MELNWIKVAIGVITFLIFYAIYKMINIIKDINDMKKHIKLIDEPKQHPQERNHNESTTVHVPQVKSTPVQPTPTHHNNQQPIQIKLQPPTLITNKSMEREEFVMVDKEEVSDASDTSDSEIEEDESYDEFENDDDAENMDAFTKDMIIPLDLNSILEQVIADKMASKKPSAEIEEINSPSSEQTPTDNSHKTNELKSKTIAELKEMAKSFNIKLTENGKPKNKETLIKEISNL